MSAPNKGFTHKTEQSKQKMMSYNPSTCSIFATMPTVGRLYKPCLIHCCVERVCCVCVCARAHVYLCSRRQRCALLSHLLSDKKQRFSIALLKTCYFEMLLLLLSRFSRVRLCATPQTAAHQAPPSDYSAKLLLTYILTERLFRPQSFLILKENTLSDHSNKKIQLENQRILRILVYQIYGTGGAGVGRKHRF